MPVQNYEKKMRNSLFFKKDMENCLFLIIQLKFRLVVGGHSGFGVVVMHPLALSQADVVDESLITPAMKVCLIDDRFGSVHQSL